MLVNKIVFYLFLLFIYLFKIIPFRILYLFSDFIYFIFYSLLSYRKKVVNLNLRKCFPDLNEKEIKALREKFYRIFCDLLLETIKGLTMPKPVLLQRFKAINNHIADKYFEQNKDVIIVLGHFANWEWAVATLVDEFKHQPAVLYKPITNQFINEYIQKKRARFGIDLVSIHQTHEYFSKTKPKPVAYYMIADQFTPNKTKQITVNFFNSKTGFLHGPEKYSKLLDIPVLYIEIQKVKRGFYTIELIEMSEHPKNLNENELTQMFANQLEKSIMKQPENWIWSHKRWKKELYSFD
jgi:Kdo2-lipid IVA lauroyltransferase/acyltransferase